MKKRKPTSKTAPCPCGSGLTFDSCHGVQLKPEAKPDGSPQLTLAPSPVLVRLDLAAGQSVREGFEGVDVWPGSKHVVDLTKFPWPFADNSVDELHCSHYVEHIPCREVEERDVVEKPGVETKFVGKDMLFAFFDECYRILKPDCFMTVICPCARSNRAFQDPTHRRFIVAETFLYMNAEWRKLNKLDHYRATCDFGVDVVPCVPTELTLLSPEVQQRRFNESWNVVLDWQAKMKSLKKA